MFLPKSLAGLKLVLTYIYIYIPLYACVSTYYIVLAVIDVITQLQASVLVFIQMMHAYVGANMLQHMCIYTALLRVK